MCCAVCSIVLYCGSSPLWHYRPARAAHSACPSTLFRPLETGVHESAAHGIMASWPSPSATLPLRAPCPPPLSNTHTHTHSPLTCSAHRWSHRPAAWPPRAGGACAAQRSVAQVCSRQAQEGRQRHALRRSRPACPAPAWHGLCMQRRGMHALHDAAHRAADANARRACLHAHSRAGLCGWYRRSDLSIHPCLHAA